VLDTAVGWGGAVAGAGAPVQAVMSTPSIVTTRPKASDRGGSERESIVGLQITVMRTARPHGRHDRRAQRRTAATCWWAS